MDRVDQRNVQPVTQRAGDVPHPERVQMQDVRPPSPCDANDGVDVEKPRDLEDSDAGVPAPPDDGIARERPELTVARATGRAKEENGDFDARSEERRVGKEGRSRWSP